MTPLMSDSWNFFLYQMGRVMSERATKRNHNSAGLRQVTFYQAVLLTHSLTSQS